MDTDSKNSTTYTDSEHDDSDDRSDDMYKPFLQAVKTMPQHCFKSMRYLYALAKTLATTPGIRPLIAAHVLQRILQYSTMNPDVPIEQHMPFCNVPIHMSTQELFYSLSVTSIKQYLQLYGVCPNMSTQELFDSLSSH